MKKMAKILPYLFWGSMFLFSLNLFAGYGHNDPNTGIPDFMIGPDRVSFVVGGIGMAEKISNSAPENSQEGCFVVGIPDRATVLPTKCFIYWCGYFDDNDLRVEINGRDSLLVGDWIYNAPAGVTYRASLKGVMPAKGHRFNFKISELNMTNGNMGVQVFIPYFDPEVPYNIIQLRSLGEFVYTCESDPVSFNIVTISTDQEIRMGFGAGGGQGYDPYASKHQVLRPNFLVYEGAAEPDTIEAVKDSDPRDGFICDPFPVYSSDKKLYSDSRLTGDDLAAIKAEPGQWQATFKFISPEGPYYRGESMIITFMAVQCRAFNHDYIYTAIPLPGSAD